jgi:hypothetical protein
MPRNSVGNVTLFFAFWSVAFVAISHNAMAQQAGDGPPTAVVVLPAPDESSPDTPGIGADAVRAAIRRSIGLAAQEAAGGSSTSTLRDAIRRIAATDTPPAGANLPSSVVGTAHDPSGLAVTGVNVTIKNLATDETRSTTSDASGRFEVQNLTPGSYEISAEKSGFRDANATIVLAASERLHADFRLKLADAAENPATAPGTKAPDLETLETRIEQLETELAALRAASAPSAGQGPRPDAALQKPSEPFAFADFTWLNGNSRQHKPAFDSDVFTLELRVDTNITHSLNSPTDHTITGSAELARADELQLQQFGFGGDFHYSNVRARLMTQFGLFSSLTPRNDASTGRGQWLQNGDLYRYLAEAYGGYHIDKMHGINVDFGIFMSYVGLFSYYNYDNWAYQPSYVSANTPWFFQGMRIQIFPTEKFKQEIWVINGWQSYGTYYSEPGFGGQTLWRPNGSLSFLSNNYYGKDSAGNPDRRRFHTDNSATVKFYENKDTPITKNAMSFTFDWGCEWGNGVVCSGGSPSTAPLVAATTQAGCLPCSQFFLGWMAYDRTWFAKDKFAVTVGGGWINNPGRYLAIIPVVNGASAVTGTPYFTENPGDQLRAWDWGVTFDYMPRDEITFRLETGYRKTNVPYWSGRGGVTPPGGNTGTPGTAIPGWIPDLATHEGRIMFAMMVKL